MSKSKKPKHVPLVPPEHKPVPPKPKSKPTGKNVDGKEGLGKEGLGKEGSGKEGDGKHEGKLQGKEGEGEGDEKGHGKEGEGDSGGDGSNFSNSRFELFEFLKKIVDWILLILKLAVIIVLIRLLYIWIFKGYSRITYDISTFSLFKQQNIDAILNENKNVINSIKKITENFPNLQLLCKIAKCKKLSQLIYDSTNSLIASSNSYNGFTGETRLSETNFMRALKDNYLLYIYINDAESKMIQLVGKGDGKGDKRTNVPYHKFYEKLVEYKISIGELKSKSVAGVTKDADTQLGIILQEDLSKKYLLNLQNFKSFFTDVGDNVQYVLNSLKAYPVFQHVITPDDTALELIIKDFSNKKEQIENGTIFTPSVLQKTASDMFWTYLEYDKKTPYGTLEQLLPIPINQNHSDIIYYINLPRIKKYIAERRIMNYKENVQYFEFIKKHPIFTHIYYSALIHPSEKSNMYNAVMDCFNILEKYNLTDSSLRGRLVNLVKNGNATKEMILSLFHIHLFFNLYKDDLIKIINEQIISTEQWFKKMMDPFWESLVVHKIGGYFWRTFHTGSYDIGITASYNKFGIFYKSIGSILKEAIKKTFKAFFTKRPVEEPIAPTAEKIPTE